MTSAICVYALAVFLISAKVDSSSTQQHPCRGKDTKDTSSDEADVTGSSSYYIKPRTWQTSTQERTSIFSPLKSIGKYDQNDVMTPLVEFLLRQTSQRQIIVVHDGYFSAAVSNIIRSCQNEMMDMIILDFEADLLEWVLRSTFYTERMRNVLLLCSPGNTTTIFQRVAQRNMESPTVQWLVVVDGEIAHLKSILREGTQVAVAFLQSDDLFDIFSSYVTLNNSISFRKVGEWETQEEPTTTEPNAPFLSFTVLRKTDGGKPLVASWYLREPLFPALDKVYDDFKGRHLIVSVVNNIPWFKLNYLEDATALPDYGIDYEVMNALSYRLNFTYSILEPEDGRWGGPEADGTISGMIGVVASHRAHMAIDEITITVARSTVVQFTNPYFLDGTSLVSRAPTKKDPTTAIIQPFTPLLWALVIIMAAVIGPIGYAIKKCHDLYRPRVPQVTTVMYNMRHNLQEWRNSRGDLEAPRSSIPIKAPESSLQHYSFNMFRSLVLQGNLIVADGIPIRIVLVSWYIFCMVVYSLYAGTLTAFMTIPAFEKPIDSLEDLLRATKDGFAPAVQPGTSNEYVLKSATSGIFKELWDLTDPSRSFPPKGQIALKRILSHDIVYMAATVNAEIRTRQRNRRLFHLSSQKFLPQPFGIACRMGAPYIQKLNRILGRILESGMLNKWTNDEISKIPGTEGGGEDSNDPEGLSINHLQAAFFLLLGGVVLSLVVFILENLHRSCCSKSDFA